jgi:hypothetical protein
MKHPEGTASVFDQDLKDIEVELNAHYDELVNESQQESWNWLLSHQIARLQVWSHTYIYVHNERERQR